ncbi:MAG: BatD family protein [Victivallaceae bacterium]|nr:BatD family protein [Victivallaceae bacterium]
MPETVEVGEVADYTMTLPGEPDTPLPFPKLENAEWVTSRTSRQIVHRNINGRETNTYNLMVGIRALKPGRVAVPGWSVKVNGKDVDIAAAEFNAVPAGDKPVAADDGGGAISLKEAAFGEVTLPGDRRTVYTGEEIPLEISLYTLRQTGIRPASYPVLSGMGDVVFHDYGKVNRESRQFAPPLRRLVNRDGRVFDQLLFATRFRAVRPGVIEPAAKLVVGVPEQRKKSERRSAMSSFFDDDDFFSFAAPRYREVEIVCKPASRLDVKPLPPAPAGAVFTGLVGAWKLTASLDRKSVPAGEAVTLDIVATGEGGVDGVAAPVIEIAGFRVYPGEVKTTVSGDESVWSAKYAAIPLREGAKAGNLRFSWFDVDAGKYKTLDFAPELAVTAPVAAAPAAVFDAAPAPSAEKEPQSPPSPVRDELFPPKPEAGGVVKLPLWRNQLPWLPPAFLGVLAMAAILELRRARMHRLAVSPEYRRRLELRRRRPAVCAAIRQSSDDRQFLQAIHAEVAPFAAESLGLPPGTTPAELALHIDDPELRTLFAGGENASFMPGAVAPEVKLNSGLRRKLLKFVKSLMCFLVLGVVFVPSLPGNGELNAAYYAGDYRKAAAQYESMLTDGSGKSPALLYNLGSAFYQSGNLPRAKYCFALAHLLDPLDQETLENLNLVNRKLVQPEVGTTSSPLELLLWCRDRMRPDQYFALAAMAVALLVLSVALRDALGRRWFAISASTLGAAAVIAAAALAGELNSNYSSDRAVVTAATLELRTLPAAGAGRVEASIPGGADARVTERRGDWLHVEVNGREGWCAASGVGQFFPDGALF